MFGFQRKIRKLRKKWDRLREKALKKKEPIRHLALEKLDSIENHLRILEEQRLSRRDRARLSKEIEIDLAEVTGLLESKPEELGSPEYQTKG
ncbi:MAG: hypothetical protein DRP27_10280 [Thermotogae bacterium]|nr:MAG: hypothetical protein DRP27_10280 [Thermotogota bacterium]